MSLSDDDAFARALLEQTVKLVGDAVAGVKSDLKAEAKARAGLEKEMNNLRQENEELKKRVTSLEQEQANTKRCSCSEKLTKAFSAAITQVTMDEMADQSCTIPDQTCNITDIPHPPVLTPFQRRTFSKKRKSHPAETVTKPT